MLKSIWAGSTAVVWGTPGLGPRGRRFEKESKAGCEWDHMPAWKLAGLLCLPVHQLASVNLSPAGSVVRGGVLRWRDRVERWSFGMLFSAAVPPSDNAVWGSAV